MNYKSTLIAGAVFAALGVAIGAFGGRALKQTLIDNNRSDTFELGVRYQFYHALALLITGILMRLLPDFNATLAPVCFILGILFFSGSLFALSLTGKTVFGAITPIGGVLFLAGWIILILKLARTNP
jgi:uncharacterized membrane protein YgdD (TMEM256/DUF423 family)